MTYKQPYHYSEDELFRAALDDLIVDLRCAKRDGLLDYAAKVESRIWDMIRPEGSAADRIMQFDKGDA